MFELESRAKLTSDRTGRQRDPPPLHPVKHSPQLVDTATGSVQSRIHAGVKQSVSRRFRFVRESCAFLSGAWHRSQGLIESSSWLILRRTSVMSSLWWKEVLL